MRRNKTPKQITLTRRQHHDPHTEAKLQAILSLRRAAERNTIELDEHYKQLRKVSNRIARHPNWTAAKYQRREIERINSEIMQINNNNITIHSKIISITETLENDDLLWLKDDNPQ
jgi:hypothetical protein